MRKMLVFALFFSLGIAQGAVVEMEGGDTVSKILMARGCSITWLSQVVASSDIDPQDLRKLRIGTPLIIQDDGCEREAPPFVANMSHLILKIDAAAEKEVGPGALEEIASLKLKLEATKEALAKSDQALAKSEQARLRAKEAINELSAQLRTKRQSRSNLPLLLALGFLVLLVAVAAYRLAKVSQKKPFGVRGVQQISFPLEIVAVVDGEESRFTFDSYGPDPSNPDGKKVALYLCSCQAKVQEKNFERHLRKAHLTYMRLSRVV